MSGEIDKSATATRRIEKPRRSKAEATLNAIMADHRPMLRRITMSVFVSRLTLAITPVAIGLLLDPLLAKQTLTIFGLRIVPSALLMILVGLGIVAAVIRGVAEYYFVATSGRCGHSIVARCRIAMYEHVLRLPTSYADNRGTGKILLRFLGDSDAFRSWVSRKAPSVRVDFVMLGVLLVAMFIVQWQLAIVMVIPLGGVWLTVRHHAPHVKRITREARRQQSMFSGEVGNRFDNLRQAKWIDSDKRTRRVIRELAQSVALLNTERDRHAARLQGIGQGIAFLTIPLLFAIGVLLTWQGQISIGRYVAFVWLAAHMASTLRNLNAAVAIREKANVSIDRILHLLQRTAERGRSSQAVKFKSLGKSVEIRNVRFAGFEEAGHFDNHFVGSGIFALDAPIPSDVLFDTLLGFRKPSGGEILIDGQKLIDVRIDSVRKAFAWISAAPILFNDTVLNNIHAASPRQTDQHVCGVVAKLLGEHSDQWLDQQVGDKGQLLSASERTEISILRASIQHSNFLLVGDLPESEATDLLLSRVVRNVASTGMVFASLKMAKRLELIIEPTGGPWKSQERLAEVQPSHRSQHVSSRN